MSWAGAPLREPSTLTLCCVLRTALQRRGMEPMLELPPWAGTQIPGALGFPAQHGTPARAWPPLLPPTSLLTLSPPPLHSEQLLTTQGVSCAHVYSALDQTARKINLARFTHGKCSTLIVTDLAARGLDIPLLDSVINYSFPAKGKLFLHRVGKGPAAGHGPGQALTTGRGAARGHMEARGGGWGLQPRSDP